MRKKLRIRRRTKKKIVKRSKLFKKRITLSDLYKNADPEKKILIKKIYKLEPIYKTLKINLAKFTLEELQHHIDKVESKRK